MATYFPKIYDVVDGNPFRDVILELKEVKQEPEETGGWDCFVQKPLQPPGSLSFFVSVSDPIYSVASPALRRQILIEKILEIEERVDKELVGRRWSRKKVHDALGEQINSPRFCELVEQILCELYQIQKVVIHRRDKAISFVPSDLRLWQSNRQIYVTDDEGCWMYEVSEPKNFLEWLTEKEEDCWKVQWPTAEGKMEELKAEVLKRNLVAKALPGTNAKVKKDDWARTLGRCEAIETLARLGLLME